MRHGGCEEVLVALVGASFMLLALVVKVSAELGSWSLPVWFCVLSLVAIAVSRPKKKGVVVEQEASKVVEANYGSLLRRLDSLARRWWATPWTRATASIAHATVMSLATRLQEEHRKAAVARTDGLAARLARAEESLADSRRRADALAEGNALLGRQLADAVKTKNVEREVHAKSLDAIQKELEDGQDGMDRLLGEREEMRKAVAEAVGERDAFRSRLEEQGLKLDACCLHALQIKAIVEHHYGVGRAAADRVALDSMGPGKEFPVLSAGAAGAECAAFREDRGSQ